MPEPYKIWLLKKAANVDNQLFSAWTTVETIISRSLLDTASTYVEYMEHLVSHAEKSDESKDLLVTNQGADNDLFIETKKTVYHHHCVQH